MDNWLIPTIRLPSTIKPKVIPENDLKQKVYISRNCTTNPFTNQTSFWWEVYQTRYRVEGDSGDVQGIVFFTWSEKVTQQLVAYSLVTFYVVVVLGIGRGLRAVIQTRTEEIFITEMPRPDSLLLI